MSVVEFPTPISHLKRGIPYEEELIHSVFDVRDRLKERNRAIFLRTDTRDARAAEYLERKAEQAAAAEFRPDVALIAVLGLLIIIFFQLQN